MWLVAPRVLSLVGITIGNSRLNRPYFHQSSRATKHTMAAVRTALDELGTNGAFKRTAASFRNSITSTGGQFPAEVNRCEFVLEVVLLI